MFKELNRLKKMRTLFYTVVVFFVLLFVLNTRTASPALQCPEKVVRPKNCTNAVVQTIYAVTPTYARPVQKAELTRLSQTLRWLESFHWIIVEDAESKTNLVRNLLEQSTMNYTHLIARTDKRKKLKSTDPHWIKARGVEQRNEALRWLREHLKDQEKWQGVVYFMDDDNTYDLRIFDEMRFIKKVGVWPVGLVGGMMVEKPIVSRSGQVKGFNSLWRPERPFPIDMASFAIHVSLLQDHPEAMFSHKAPPGYQESEILRHLITIDDLEPLADMCTKVYVWHTRTETPKLHDEKKFILNGGNASNLGMEV